MISLKRGMREYSTCLILALAVAGLISFSMTFLSETQRPVLDEIVERTIRLSQPEPDREPEDDQRPPESKPEPPKKLLKEFSMNRQAAAPRSAMDLQLPVFSADLNPLLGGGLALPEMSGLGGLGFNIDEVDVKPQVLRSLPPEYPYGAKRNRVEGKVVVRLLVNTEGRPERMSVYSSTPEGVFDKAALGAARCWMFKPGRYEGKAVSTWVLIPFNFELNR